MLRFQNDYSEGAHPNVLRALCDTNLSATPGYGLDDDCRRAADAIRARFACPDADVHFLVGGTQTNLLAAAAFLRPWEAMVAADTGHVNVHETGAIEATGHKVIAVPGADGKLTPAAIADAAAQHCAQPGVYDEHMVLPRMAALSEVQWCDRGSREWTRFAGALPHIVDIYERMGYNYSPVVFGVNCRVRSLPEKKCVEVTLSTLGDAPIHYTLDPSEPTAESPPNPAPIQIPNPCTLNPAPLPPRAVRAKPGLDRADVSSLSAGQH